MNQPMNREQKRMQQRQGVLAPDGTQVAPKRDLVAERQARQNAGNRRSSLPQFLAEVKGELRKVAWPTKPEVINYSIVVLVTLVLVTTYIALLDFGLAKAATALFK